MLSINDGLSVLLSLFVFVLDIVDGAELFGVSISSIEEGLLEKVPVSILSDGGTYCGLSLSDDTELYDIVPGDAAGLTSG